MTLPGLLSLRAYSRHRGCSLAAVQRAIRDGRLRRTVTHDAKGAPKITAATEADAEWSRSTDPTKAEAAAHQMLALAKASRRARARPAGQVNGNGQAAAGDAPAIVIEARLPDGGTVRGDPAYVASVLRVSAAEMTLAERAGRLVPTEDVAATWQAHIGIARGRMLALPHRLKARLPHLTLDDVAAIEEEIRHALEVLAESDADAPTPRIHAPAEVAAPVEVGSPVGVATEGTSQ